MMFFATAGGGTESFLASEIKEKLEAKVSFRNGKVFFSKENITSDLQKILSLRAAERVFVMIADYDNSNFVSGKRIFLDKIMAWLSREGIYDEANTVLKHMRDILSRQQDCFKQVPKTTVGSAEDKTEHSEPKEKCARIEIGNGQQPEDVFKAPVETCRALPKDPFSNPFTFRMSIKCSGKLRKRLDLKRLSRDLGWRVERASGWRIQLRQPDLEVCVHISDEHVTVGVPLTSLVSGLPDDTVTLNNVCTEVSWHCAIDSNDISVGVRKLRQSRLPLSKRHYLQDPGLRTPVAWIMCCLAEIQPGDLILDPMCGKATILIEGTSNWQDAFYIGGDNSVEQINSATQNVSHSDLTTKMDLCTSDGLHMPFRECCVDVIVCDAPFNQNHLTSSNPAQFYKKFLGEIHRVLRPNGKCVLLVSEELASVVRALLQSSVVASVTDMDLEDSHRERPTTNVSFQHISLHSCVSDVWERATTTGETVNPSDESVQNFQLKHLISSERSINLDGPNLTHPCEEPVNPVPLQEKIDNSHSSSLVLTSQHPVKLGETMACILKLIKR